MAVGSLAGVAVLFELVSLAYRDQLAARLHSPTNVWLAAACVFVFGLGLAQVAPKTARWFAMFATAGAWSSASIAAYGKESTYAAPLLCVGFAAIIVVVVTFRTEGQLRRARAG